MISALAVLALVFTAGMFLLEESSNVDGANAVITGDTNVVKTGGTMTYQIMFFESEDFDTLEIEYSAVLKNSSGTTQSSAVSPSSGTLANGVETTLTITAPSTAGKYTLTVTFTETIDDGDDIKIERTQTINVTKPITLTAVMKNNSNVDFTDFAVYFYVDNEFVEGSRTLISVASGESTTITYDWVTESLSNGKHTFKVVAGEENIGDFKDVLLGAEGEFYVGHSDYGIVNILLGILLLIFVIVLIYLWRKPVKNYGKPKSRR